MRRIWIFLLALPVLFACTETIEIELDSTYTSLVVFGEITTDTTTHKVELKKSADYYFNQPAEKVRNALVTLSYSDTSFILKENPDLPGFYETRPDFYGIPGETYTLTIEDVDVNADGESEFYTASSYLPAVNSIDSIKLVYTSNSFFSGWEIQVWTFDPANVKNYYIFKTRVNGRLVTDTLSEYVIQNDDLFDGSYTYGITSQFLLESDEDERLNPGDIVTFEANGITEEYYNFLLQAQNESFGQNPLFSGPPANISSNISNGALGFFTAYSISRSNAVVPKEKPTGEDGIF
ncbi:MAG: DUF4249 domain-containing protein [Bacteroidota bacterium]